MRNALPELGNPLGLGVLPHQGEKREKRTDAQNSFAIGTAYTVEMERTGFA